MKTKTTHLFARIFSQQRRGTAILAILMISLIGLIGCQNLHEGPTEIVESSFVVGESVQLEVNGFNGSITINSGLEGQVLVRASLRQPDRLEYSTHQDGDKIVITARRLGNFFDLLSRASAKIDV